MDCRGFNGFSTLNSDLYWRQCHFSSSSADSVSQQPKLKTKAYLNPQIINYERIKKCLTQGSVIKTNKIHFNPNFKGKSENVTQLVQREQVPLRSEPAEKCHGMSQNSNNKDINVVNRIPVQKEKTNFELLSKYKLINVQKPGKNHSMYSWSNDCTNNESILNDGSARQSNLGSTSDISNKHFISNKSRNMSHCRSKIQLKHVVLNNRMKPSVSNIQLHDKKSQPIYVSKTKVINKCTNKLNTTLSAGSSKTKQTKQFVTSKVNQTHSNYTYNKLKDNKKVDNHKISKYKIDKRKKLHYTKKSSLNSSDIKKLFPTHYYKRRNIMYNPRGLFHYKSFGSKSLFLWRTHNLHNKIKENKTKNSLNRRIVKIGGIFYKAASNKLIVAESKKKVKTEGQRIKVNANKKKVRKNHIVYVRGEKFSLHKNGKTLVRESQGVDKKSNSGTLRRIDIGGVTYLQKSKNILIRTNVHQARQIVNNAKHKSIATLCKLRKRSALPCMIYHKFGKCARHKKGLCMYKHDPKNIAVCRKFLKGNCDGTNCLLSHEIIQEKMATCHFFLNGCCNRDNCSFLHVKISESAEICKNFLHGFCDLGENCDKKHLFQCPKYEKDGKCSLGNKCPYPHKSKKCTKNYKTDKKSNNSVPCTSKQPKTKGKEKEERPILTLSNHQTIDKSVSATSDQITPEIECVPQRVKLDKLPAFIPLQSDV